MTDDLNKNELPPTVAIPGVNEYSMGLADEITQVLSMPPLLEGPPSKEDAEKILATLRTRSVQVLPEDNSREYAYERIMDRKWRSSIALFSRRQDAKSIWQLVFVGTQHEVEAFGDAMQMDCEYRIVDLVKLEIFASWAEYEASREPKLAPPVPNWTDVISFQGQDDDAILIYEASIEAAINTLHGLGWDVHESLPEKLTADSVVGGEAQNLVMAGYHRALLDILTGEVSLAAVARAASKMGI